MFLYLVKLGLLLPLPPRRFFVHFLYLLVDFDEFVNVFVDLCFGFWGETEVDEVVEDGVGGGLGLLDGFEFLYEVDGGLDFVSVVLGSSAGALSEEVESEVVLVFFDLGAGGCAGVVGDGSGVVPDGEEVSGFGVDGEFAFLDELLDGSADGGADSCEVLGHGVFPMVWGLFLS